MKFLIITVIILAALSLASPTAFAQVINIWEGTGGPEGTCNVKGPCTFCDAAKVASNITDFLVQLTLILGVAMTMWGAFQMMMSGGSEERYKKGKNTIVWAVIGIAVALGSWIIVNTLLHLLTGRADFPWSDIVCG